MTNNSSSYSFPRCSIRLFTGPARSGLTTRLISEVRPALTEPEPRKVLWLVPSHRAGERLREQLVDSGVRATLSIWIGTFDSLASEVLAGSGLPFRPIGGELRWELLHLIVRKLAAQGELQYFRPIASTSGLTDRLYHWISRCQRVGVDPDRIRQTLDGEPSPRISEFLKIFSEYQETCRTNRWYDAQRRLWEADRLLREGAVSLSLPTEIVVLDGFLELLPAELAILQTLARHVREVLATLLMDPKRPDLFSKTSRTRDRLLSLFGQASVQEECVGAATYFESAGLRHLERYLFFPPGEAPAAEDTTGVKIIVGANVAQEVELVAQEIKRLLIDGDPDFGDRVVRPKDVVVVVRSFAEYADRIWQTFREFGIPTYIEGGLPLSRVGIIRALLTLIALEVESWPLPKLLAILRNRYFRPRWLEGGDSAVVAQVETVLRSLNLAGGKEAVLEQLRNWVSAKSQEEQQPGAENPCPELRTLQIVQELAECFSSWREVASWGEWIRRWTLLAERCGLLSELSAEISPAKQPEAMGKSPPWIPAENGEELRLLDRRAWIVLSSKLGELQNLYEATGIAEQAFTAKEAFELLRQIAARTVIIPQPEESGRVRVLSPASASSLSAPYVFVMGLTQGSYPTPMPELSVWNKEELLRLGKLGIEAISLTAKVEEEMLLFYRLVTRASRRLFLSYPAADEAGEALLPSPFLEEIELACGKERIAKQLPESLSPLPRAERPFTIGHWRIKAVNEAISARTQLLELLCGPESNSTLGTNIRHGFVVRIHRGRFRVFTAFDGMLAGKRIREALKRVFQQQPSFSPTQLESYAACPFRFLLRDLLGIEPPPEVRVETDFLQRGLRFHHALAKFHQTLIERCGKEVCYEDIRSEFSDQALREIWEESFEPPPQGSPSSLAAAGYELDRRRWQAFQPTYLEQWQNYDKYCEGHFGTVFKPKWFERWIGRQRGQGEEGPPEPYLLKLDKRETLRLHGRIDRIDVAQMGDTTWLAILDYKSGSSPPVAANSWKESLANGIGLQLALYLLAAEENYVLPPPAIPIFGGYWMLSGRGLAERSVLSLYEVGASPKKKSDIALTRVNDWEKIKGEILQQTCLQILNAIRRGDFPPVPISELECRGCPYRTVCRVGECKDLLKTWSWKE